MPSELKQVITHTFDGAMQRDTALWVIQPNSYYEGVNIRIFQMGQQFIITNPLGNTEIPFDLPDGENYCLGSYGDTENNRFYWMNWNENGFHGVYMYNYTLNKVVPVLINLDDTGGIDILRFRKRSLILMIDVIKNPKGQDMIYWVDGQVKQKKFNIQKALDKSPAGYGMTITATDINAYKLAANAPSTNYFTDTNRQTNFLYGHLYKASVRWWFDDGEKNNWSEFSTVALPFDNGFSGNPSVSNVNNTLLITAETGPSIVTHIEIALKDGDNNFVSIVTLEKAKFGISDDTTYAYNFYNDNTSYSGLDQLKVYKAYSFMPRLAALQAFCQNAIVYGKGVEGFPSVDIIISTEVVYSDLFVASDVVNELNEPVFTATLIDHDYTREGSGRRRNSLIEVTVGNDVKNGNRFQLFGRNGESDNLSYTYLAGLADTATTVADAFKQQLVATGRILSTSQDLPDTDIWVNTIDGSGNVKFRFIWRGRFAENTTVFSGRVNAVSIQTLKDNGQSVLTQKSGDSINYGVLYWNEDTYRSNVYTSPGAFVRNDFVTQTGGFKKIDHRISIESVPPEWATHWELVRTTGLTYGTLPTDYIQFLVQKAIESQSTDDTDYVDLIIGSIYTYQEMYPNTIVRYEFQKNDRVRLIKKESNGTYYPFTETIVLDFKEVGVTETVDANVTTDNTSTVMVATSNADNIGRYIVIDNVEREIIAAPTGTTYTLNRPFGTTETYTSYQIVDKRGIIRVRKPIGITIEDNSLIEVYKPTQNVATAEKNFFLFGQKYAIQNAGTALRAHTGNVQNQDPGDPANTPAIISVNEGTSYVRNRQLPTNNAVPGTQAIVDLIEDNSFSDFYVSNLNNNGKTAPEDDGGGEIRFGSRLRYSNNYLEGTRVNGLNDFDNLDREDYNDPWGDFMLLKYRDRLLYAFKQFRVGYVPVLNSIVTTSDGDPSLSATTKFLNQYQTFAWEGGIGNNPESYASDQTWQYFLSPNSGTDCRIGGDGILPTSHQFGLSQTVRDYTDASQKYGGFIFGGIDRQNQERILAFEAHNEYLYRGDFTEADWQLYDEDLPEDTDYEITTQPVNGEDSTPPVDGVTIYTPDTDFVGSDPSFFRWDTGAGWSDPKKICMRADDVPVPPPVPIWYNAELTVEFTRDNCQPGYHGTVVDFIVPALTFSSFFSQEDADQQAADDAAQNGQAFANDPANGGTCEANTPLEFTFTDLTELEPDTLTESDAQVISGDYDFYPISITGGEYSIDGGAWTSASGLVPDGSAVMLRRTTSPDFETQVDVVVSIGGLMDTWSLTTREAADVTVNYSMVFGSNPVVNHWNVVERIRNGVSSNVATIQNVGTGSLPAGDFKEGDIIRVYQGAYDPFMWAPDSNVNLELAIDTVEVYNGNVTTQSGTQNTGLHEIEIGTTVIDLVSTGSSEAVGYFSENLQVINSAAAGVVRVTIEDNLEAGLGLLDFEPQGEGTYNYSFNVLGTTGTLTFKIYNDSGVLSFDYELDGEGGYTESGNLAAGADITYPSATKGNFTLTIPSA